VEEEDDDDEPGVFDKAVQARSTAWWPDYISGCPSTLACVCSGSFHCVLI
jgi:hypothetical protein